MNSPTFVAIDFETADFPRDSACAVGVVKVQGLRIVHEEALLIRPPRDTFHFSYIHGITWEHVADKPPFKQVWGSLKPLFRDVEFFAAHNASFDRSVLHACCDNAHIQPPNIKFKCTVNLARQAWGIYPTKLPNVCRELDIALDHHDPLSDARACAVIMIKALKDGIILE